MARPTTHLERDLLRDLALSRLLVEGEVYLWVSDLELRPFWVSPSWLKFTGGSGPEDYVANWSERCHPDDREAISRRRLEAIAARQPFEAEYRFRRADGQWRWVHSHGLPCADDRGEIATYIVSIVDVTDRHEQEALAARERARFQEVLDAVHAAVTVVDAENRYQFVNREWEEAVGWRREDAIGRSVGDILGPELGAQSLAQLAQAVRPGDRVTGEFTLNSPDGPRTFRTERTLMKSSVGALPLVCGVATDITGLRREEALRRELEHRAAESLRLESIGLVAGGIAHDFNNLLTSVLGNLELALLELPPGATAADSIRQAQQAARRAADLTGHMLAYTGSAMLEREPVDPARLGERMRGVLAALLGEPRQLTLELEDGLSSIEADPQQLELVLVNLVTNAGEAIGERPGTVALRLRNRVVDPEHPCRFASGIAATPGRYVEFEVRDDGCGMDGDTMVRAFDPFFTTKFVGRGLGLAAVRGIVRAHGGGIELESTPGAGSTFRVLVPAMTAAPAPAVPAAS